MDPPAAAAAAELDRAGVDSKFFRSLSVVAAIAAVLFLVALVPAAREQGSLFAGWPDHPWPAVGAAAAALFSLYRFCDRRWKGTEQTCRYYVLGELAGKKDKPDVRDVADIRIAVQAHGPDPASP